MKYFSIKITSFAQSHVQQLEDEILLYMKAHKVTKSESFQRMNECCIFGTLISQENKILCQNFKKKEGLPEDRMISTEFCEKCLRERELNESLQWEQYLEEKRLFRNRCFLDIMH